MKAVYTLSLLAKQHAFIILASILLTVSCTAPNKQNNEPNTVIWAWERPEDLRFLDPSRHAVAFLAQTLIAEGEDVVFQPRRQPIQFSPGTYLIAVTRIETSRDNAKRPGLSQDQRKVSSNIEKEYRMPNVKPFKLISMRSGPNGNSIAT